MSGGRDTTPHRPSASIRPPLRVLALAYRLIGAVTIAIGVVRVTDLGTPEFTPMSLLTFTTLSNVLGAAWMSSAAIVTIRRMRRSGRHGDASVAPRVGAALALALLVTSLIYLAILAPEAFARGGDHQPFTLTDNLVHIFGPAFVVGDWLLFGRRGVLRWWDPVWWAVIPYAYVAFALLRPVFTDTPWPNGSAYPYPFFDPTDQGWLGVVVFLLVLTVAMEAIAFAMVVFDRLVGRWSDARDPEHARPAVTGG